MRADVVHRRGFVLIELVVVVTIIALLAVGAWVSSRYLVVTSKVARVKEEEKTLMRALSNYEIDYSTLPDDEIGLNALNAPTAYLASLPRDPFAPDRGTYRYIANPFSEFRYILISPGPDGEYDLDPVSLAGPWGSLIRTPEAQRTSKRIAGAIPTIRRTVSTAPGTSSSWRGEGGEACRRAG